MSITQPTLLATAITNCEEYKIFRQKRSGGTQKWQNKLDQLCSQIETLSSLLENGNMIDGQLLQSVVDRINKISKNFIIHEQQEKLLSGKERLVRAILKRFTTSFTPSAAPLFPECSKSTGFCGWLARALYFQSAVGAVPALSQTSDSSLGSALALSDPQIICEARLFEAVQVCPAKFDPSNRSEHKEEKVHCRNATRVGNGAAAPIVKDQTHLGGIVPGSWCFFSHYPSKITHFIISNGQKMFGATWELVKNVTHVGILEKVVGSVFDVSEIPAYGAAVSTNSYDLKAMKEGESLLFVSPNEMVSERPANGLNQVIRGVARQIAPISPVSGENQYDVMGASMAVFRPGQFSEDDKRELIEGFIDYKYGLKQKKKYFCSQFVMEFSQLGRIIQKYPDVYHIIKQKLSGIDVQDSVLRASAVRRIVRSLETSGIWNKISQDPIFKIPPRSSTPASMLSLVAQGALITRVTNPVSIPHFDPNHSVEREVYPEYIEYMVTKLLVKCSAGLPISVRDSEVQSLFAVLQKEAGYSRETLNCFFEQCMSGEDIPGCIEGCLDKTLTWREKITIFFISIGLNREVGRLLTNPDFITFVRDPKPEEVAKFVAGTTKDSFMDDLLAVAFPMKFFHPIASLENYFLRRSARSNDLPMLLKYLPLAFAYDPPTGEIQTFMKKNSISKADLTKRVIAFLFSHESKMSLDGSV